MATTTTARVTGPAGGLRVSYQHAAALGRWALTLRQAPGARVYDLTASLLAHSPYWMGEAPMSLDLDVGPDRWTWTPVDIQVDGGVVTATVSGVPEIARGAAGR